MDTQFFLFQMLPDGSHIGTSRCLTKCFSFEKRTETTEAKMTFYAAGDSPRQVNGTEAERLFTQIHG